MVLIPRFGRKKRVKSVVYQGNELNLRARLDPEVVENFSVYVKTLQKKWQSFLAFPHGSPANPKTKEQLIDTEYRVKGIVRDDSLELAVERLEPSILYKKTAEYLSIPEAEKLYGSYSVTKIREMKNKTSKRARARQANNNLCYTKRYIPVSSDDPNLDSIVRRYIAELSNYTSGRIKEKHVDKALKSWRKGLNLRQDASDILRNYVLQNSREYHTRECTMLILPHIGGLLFKGGQMMCAGSFETHTYRRRISPIIGVPPFNLLNNVLGLMMEKTMLMPQEAVFENPEQNAIILPPLIGGIARKHETRHCLQHAAFHELLNPFSELFVKCNSDEARQKTNYNLDGLVKYYFPATKRITNHFDDVDRKIVGEFHKGNSLYGLLNEIKDNDMLANDFERGIISGMLFSRAYAYGQKYYEATASSFRGNIELLTFPWLPVLPFLLFPQLLYIVAPLTLGLNLLSAKYGYGNLPAFLRAKKYLTKYSNSAENQLRAIACLGKLKL